MSVRIRSHGPGAVPLIASRISVAPQLATSLSLEVLGEAEGTIEPFERDAIFEPIRSRFVQPRAGRGTYTQELDAANERSGGGEPGRSTLDGLR